MDEDKESPPPYTCSESMHKNMPRPSAHREDNDNAYNETRLFNEHAHVDTIGRTIGYRSGKRKGVSKQWRNLGVTVVVVCIIVVIVSVSVSAYYVGRYHNAIAGERHHNTGEQCSTHSDNGPEDGPDHHIVKPDHGRDDNVLKREHVCDGVEDWIDAVDERKCHPVFIELPNNQIVNMGSNVSIRCKAITGVGDLQWFYTNGSQETIIWDSEFSNIFAHGYNVTHSKNTSSYELTIRSITGAQSWLTFGTRLLKTPYEHTTQITVIDEWICSKGYLEVTEGEAVHLSASINYYGYIQPSIYWYHDNQVINRTDDTTTSIINNTDYITKTVSVVQRHVQCVSAATYVAYVLNSDDYKSQYAPKSYLNTCSVTVKVLCKKSPPGSSDETSQGAVKQPLCGIVYFTIMTIVVQCVLLVVYT